MLNKYEQYRQLCDEKLGGLISSKENWLSFLDTSSRMYKYNFEEQVLIHAQRPDSRAVASFEFWTSASKMNRHIKRGTNSIALIDRDRKRLSYVYAVEDTEERANGKSQNPENYIWKITPQLVDSVNANLCTKGKIDSDSLEKTLTKLCSSMSNSRLNEYNATFDTLYSESNTTRTKEEVSEDFSKMLSASTAIVAMKRCGIDTSNFESTLDFSALERLPAKIGELLGKATGDVSKQVLQQYVVPAVREENEKRRNINEIYRRTVTEEESREWNPVYTGRSNPDLSSRLGNEGEVPHQEVGQGQGEISQGTQGNDIQHNVAEERTERTSSQRGLTGGGDNRTDNKVNGESRRTDRGNEGHGYAEMGRVDEQLPTDSGRNNQTELDRSITENTAEVEQKTTSAVSFADKMHSAFMQVEMQYNFRNTQQRSFMSILETYMIENQLTDIDLPKEFEKDGVFKNVFQTINNVSKIFSRRLNQILKSLKSAINDVFEAPQLTETEQNFLDAEIEPVMAKSVLAWDEIESLGYILYEEGYMSIILMHSKKLCRYR